MVRLSQNFDLDEFQRSGEIIPLEAIPTFTAFCRDVLEPLRAKFAEPFHITSGYRSEYMNARIGGARDSQHIASARQCAADGYFATYQKNMRPVFDWLREESKLPFDQCLLEWGKYGSIIHLSYVRTAPRRVAAEGATYNQSGYKSWPVSA